MKKQTGKFFTGRGLKRQGIIILLILLPVLTLNADMVCTFLGTGEDVIHEIAVRYKSSIRITFSGNGLIKRVVYNKKNFKVVNNLHEAVIRPKGDGLIDYIAVITERMASATYERGRKDFFFSGNLRKKTKSSPISRKKKHRIYIFRLKTIKKEEKSNFFDRKIIIKS